MNTMLWGRLGDNSRPEPAKYRTDKDRPERPQKIRRFPERICRLRCRGTSAVRCSGRSATCLNLLGRSHHCEVDREAIAALHEDHEALEDPSAEALETLSG